MDYASDPHDDPEGAAKNLLALQIRKQGALPKVPGAPGIGPQGACRGTTHAASAPHAVWWELGHSAASKTTQC